MTHTRNFYSVAEFCHRNSISRATFYRLCNSGRIQTSKLGRRTLISAEVEATFVSSLAEVA